MNTVDPVEKQAELVLDVYTYAFEHDLNINNKSDVKKILSALNPERSSDADAEVMIVQLNMLDKVTKDDLAKRENM